MHICLNLKVDLHGVRLHGLPHYSASRSRPSLSYILPCGTSTHLHLPGRPSGGFFFLRSSFIVQWGAGPLSDIYMAEGT